MERERDAAPLTLEAYARDLRGFVRSLGTKIITKATANDVRAFLARERERGCGSSTVRRRFAALRSLFRFLLAESVITEDPTRFVWAPRGWACIPRPLSVEQVRALLDAVPRADDPLSVRDRAVMEFLYSTGCRASEVGQVAVADAWRMLGLATKRTTRALARGEDPTLRITGKGRKERLIVVGERARVALRDYILRARPAHVRGEETPELFLARTGMPLDRRDVWRIVRRTVARAGLKSHVTTHTFRHSFATHLVSGGADLRVVQELLGHASIMTTAVYAAVDQARMDGVHKKHHPRGWLGAFRTRFRKDEESRPRFRSDA